MIGEFGRLDQNALGRSARRASERDFRLYLVTIVFVLATHSAARILRDAMRAPRHCFTLRGVGVGGGEDAVDVVEAECQEDDGLE